MATFLSSSKRYLTKSRFKLALECVTKLYYTGKKKEYSDKNLDDPFLQSLAKGGFQVGELAKYYFCNDPIKDNITIDTLDYETALTETNKRLSSNENIVIAEAAFLYENLFIRADILEKRGDTISIYEVKAKSWDENTNFLNAKGDKIMSKWIPYLYDIAFQKFVVLNALKDSGFKIKVHLMLVNKDSVATVPELNQMFKIYKQNGRYKVDVKAGLNRSDLGAAIIEKINVDEICDKIFNEFDVPTDFSEKVSFEKFVAQCSKIYAEDEKHFTQISSKCNSKKCQFYRDNKDPTELKSGFIECWQKHTGLSEIELGAPLVTELWNGKAGPKSFATELTLKGKFLLKDVEESDIASKSKPKNQPIGLSPTERRMEQINRAKEGNNNSYIDKSGIKTEMAKWNFPLHLIDFETSMVALPFHKNSQPYEGIAFQFSHHTIDKNWNIRHANEFLLFEEGKYPNYEFVRALKDALEKDNGTVFRYHNHENNYLNHIYRQLKHNSDAPSDKDALMQFIQTITHSSDWSSEQWTGHRDMVDLYELILSYYYSPLSKGSNSLKHILPAIISDSAFLKDKYGKRGIYGRGKEVSSLNFNDHVWISPEFKNNPYNTLPKVFDEYENDVLDTLVEDVDEIADGGAALTAYNYLQYSELPDEQREKIKDALLRYCELDTMAMVMICEAWNNWIK